jgi:hypothetical protein
VDPKEVEKHIATLKGVLGGGFVPQSPYVLYLLATLYWWLSYWDDVHDLLNDSANMASPLLKFTGDLKVRDIPFDPNTPRFRTCILLHHDPSARLAKLLVRTFINMGDIYTAMAVLKVDPTDLGVSDATRQKWMIFRDKERDDIRDLMRDDNVEFVPINSYTETQPHLLTSVKSKKAVALFNANSAVSADEAILLCNELFPFLLFTARGREVRDLEDRNAKYKPIPFRFVTKYTFPALVRWAQYCFDFGNSKWQTNTWAQKCSFAWKLYAAVDTYAQLHPEEEKCDATSRLQYMERIKIMIGKLDPCGIRHGDDQGQFIEGDAGNKNISRIFSPLYHPHKNRNIVDPSTGLPDSPAWCDTVQACINNYKSEL